MNNNIQRCISLFLFIFLASAIPSFAISSHKTQLSSGEPQYAIIDTHEHIQDRYQAKKYTRAMNAHNVVSIILVASPKEVLDNVDPTKDGFTNSEWNNSELLEIIKDAPDTFYAFATYSPRDTNIVAQLKKFIDHGGTGLKLYNGHYAYYDAFSIPLDAKHLLPVYAYCEKNHIPIVLHANTRYYWEELQRVLDTYPALIVNLAHFCMSIVDLDRIAEIFNTYENVYSDISCGEGELAYTSLAYLSRYSELFREFVQTYKTRFLFGTDTVLTDNTKKDSVYVEGVFACYRDMLERKYYTGNLITGYLKDKRIAETRENSMFNGLHLDADTLRHIYEINPAKFLQR